MIIEEDQEQDIYGQSGKIITYDQPYNFTYIEVNIDIYVGRSDSENDNDYPTSKNDDTKGNIKKITTPKGK